jgi:hypothetical protein
MADREEIFASGRLSPRRRDEREHEPVNDWASHPSDEGPAVAVNAGLMAREYGGSAYDLRGPHTTR